MAESFQGLLPGRHDGEHRCRALPRVRSARAEQTETRPVCRWCRRPRHRLSV